MANISFESAFKRLSLRPSTLCRQCRRSFTSTTSRHETQSATRAFSEHVQSSRTQPSPTTFASRPSNPSTTTPPSSTPPTSSTEPPRQRTANDIARDMIRQTTARRNQRAEEEKQRDLEREYSRADLEKQIPRKFKVGDVYAPHDLSGVEMAKWKKLRRKGKQRADVVDQLGVDPRVHYKNFTIMSEYMTDMGRIKHSRETGLRPKNQRKMAKAIRRAIGIGLMPGVHRHPELLKDDLKKRSNY